MADVKIEVKIGNIEFKGEGDQEWISAQLDKVIQRTSELSHPIPNAATPDHAPMSSDPNIAGQSLATFLKNKVADSNQIKKFLATAIWLEAKGQKRLSTTDVTKALKDSNQKRLSNPSEFLAQNISKGYCEKDGKQFFVTVEGKNSL